MPFFTASVSGQVTSRPNAFIPDSVLNPAIPGEPTLGEIQTYVSANNLVGVTVFYTGGDVDDESLATATFLVDANGDALQSGRLNVSLQNAITVADTTADANHTQDFATFSQTWDNMGSFDVNVTNGFVDFNVTNPVLPGAEGDLNVGLGSVVATANNGNPNGVSGEMRLDGNQAALTGSTGGAGGAVGFSVNNSGEPGSLGDAQTFLKTRAVSLGNATVGQVPRLLNAVTGEFEFSDVETDTIAPFGLSLIHI